MSEHCAKRKPEDLQTPKMVFEPRAILVMTKEGNLGLPEVE